MTSDISLCPHCHCLTKTIKRACLSGSENRHFRHWCAKCDRIKYESTEDLLFQELSEKVVSE